MSIPPPCVLSPALHEWCRRHYVGELSEDGSIEPCPCECHRVQVQRELFDTPPSAHPPSHDVAGMVIPPGRAVSRGRGR